ncbi:hypothetical protein [Brevibacterium picturae]|uniref:Uncharacterized protein n=1 Tax=Brevibacterium picturae TaxID=260553 RepID=A0ABN2CHA2_9MICO
MNAATYTYPARPTPQAHEQQQTACLALARDLDVTRSYNGEAGDPSELTRLLADVAAGKFSAPGDRATGASRADNPGRPARPGRPR